MNEYDKLTAIITKGWSFEVESVMKRIEIDSCRDFYVRYVWKAQKGYTSKQCAWKGFLTADECLKI